MLKGDRSCAIRAHLCRIAPTPSTPQSSLCLSAALECLHRDCHCFAPKCETHHWLSQPSRQGTDISKQLCCTLISMALILSPAKTDMIYWSICNPYRISAYSLNLACSKSVIHGDPDVAKGSLKISSGHWCWLKSSIGTTDLWIETCPLK